MIIRRIKSSDWLEYKTLRLNALKTAPYAFCSKYEDAILLPDTEWEKRVLRFATDPKAINFLAFHNDVPVGMLSCYIEDRAEMIQMWVEPKGRGLGAAKALIKAMIQWTKDSGENELFASVKIDNKEAYALYLALGFQKVSSHENEDLLSYRII